MARLAEAASGACAGSARLRGALQPAPRCVAATVSTRRPEAALAGNAVLGTSAGRQQPHAFTDRALRSGPRRARQQSQQTAEEPEPSCPAGTQRRWVQKQTLSASLSRLKRRLSPRRRSLQPAIAQGNTESRALREFPSKCHHTFECTGGDAGMGWRSSPHGATPSSSAACRSLRRWRLASSKAFRVGAGDPRLAALLLPAAIADLLRVDSGTCVHCVRRYEMSSQLALWWSKLKLGSASRI